MPDSFIVLYEGLPLVVIKDLPEVRPQITTILDWYGKHYAFERSKLSGYYSHMISCKEMSYDDFNR